MPKNSSNFNYPSSLETSLSDSGIKTCSASTRLNLFRFFFRRPNVSHNFSMPIQGRPPPQNSFAPFIQVNWVAFLRAHSVHTHSYIFLTPSIQNHRSTKHEQTLCPALPNPAYLEKLMGGVHAKSRGNLIYTSKWIFLVWIMAAKPNHEYDLQSGGIFIPASLSLIFSSEFKMLSGSSR